jgi:hypothetical protein
MPKLKQSESALHDWVHGLTFQQQALLMTGMRGPDMCNKHNAAKAIIRYLRGAICKPAGNWSYENDNDFMWGEYRVFSTWQKNFFDDPDGYPHHFIMHLIHCAEVIGYKHPDDVIAGCWLDFYQAGCKAFHMWAEDENEMDGRLNDFGVPIPESTPSSAIPQREELIIEKLKKLSNDAYSKSCGGNSLYHCGLAKAYDIAIIVVQELLPPIPQSENKIEGEPEDWEARYCVVNLLLQEMKIYKELAELGAPYLRDMEADNAHDPSVGMYKDEKLTTLVRRLDHQISEDGPRWKKLNQPAPEPESGKKPFDIPMTASLNETAGKMFGPESQAGESQEVPEEIEAFIEITVPACHSKTWAMREMYRYLSGRYEMREAMTERSAQELNRQILIKDTRLKHKTEDVGYRDEEIAALQAEISSLKLEWGAESNAKDGEILLLKEQIVGSMLSSRNILDQNCALVDERTRMLESNKQESNAAIDTIEELRAEVELLQEKVKELQEWHNSHL